MLACFKDQLNTWECEASEIVVFYSGHGASIGGNPFFVPVDAGEEEVEYIIKENLLGVEDIIKLLIGYRSNAGNPIIFILDCCRSEVNVNSNDTHAHTSEDLLGGTRMNFGNKKSNLAILFSTSAGDFALDAHKGGKQHSPFTEFFLENVSKNGTLNDLDMSIRKSFADTSRFRGQQMTWIYHNLISHYRFNIDDSPMDTSESPIQAKEFAQPRVFSLKYLRNNHFVDRPDAFDALNHAIEKSKKNSECIPIALCGVGGTGKSQIALEFCYRNRNKYLYLFWMAANTEVTLQKCFADTATRLSLTFAQPEFAVPKMIQWFESNEGWLIVFDNADDFSLGNGSESHRLLNEYFPKGSGGVILLTTRVNVREDKGSIINMDEYEMDDRSALKLMFRKDIAIADADPEALAIIQELCHLPLAVDLAGAAMRAEEISPAEYLERYKQDTVKWLSFEDDHDNIYGNTVFKAWDVSFERIKAKSPIATELLLSIAFLHPDNVPFNFFQDHFQINTTSDNRSWRTAANLLCDFSLLRRTIREDIINMDDPARETLTIHRLIQNVIILQMDIQERIQQCKRHISALYCAIRSKSQNFNLEFSKIMGVYVPHIVHVSRLFSEWTNQSVTSKDLTFLLASTVVYLTRQAMFEGTEELAKLAISNSEMENGLEHLDTAKAHSNLFYVYVMQRKFVAAEPHGKLALEIRRKILGISNDSARSSLHYLAYIYDTLGKWKRATLLFKEASEAYDGVAIREMARRYLYGIGIQENYEAAKELDTKTHEFSIDQLQRNFYEYGRIDFTPLHHAVQQNDINGILRRAKEYRQFVNIGDEDRRTPLHHAVEKGFVDITRLLVSEIGADTYAEDKNGWAPLRWAIERGHENVVELLVIDLMEGDLRFNRIGSEGTFILTKILRKNTALFQLNLSGNEIGYKGVYALAEYLMGNMTLTQLDLAFNRIGDKGALFLSELLKENENLTQLNLEYNMIGIEGAHFLAECLKENTTLTELNLAENLIGVDGAYLLATCLKENTALNRLNLAVNEIGDEGAHTLAECLKENTALIQLNLSFNRISDKGAHALADCLKGNTTLDKLVLSYNIIGLEGARAFAQCLKENITLTQLNLEHNKIDEEGAYILAESLKGNMSLTQLDLAFNKIGDEGAHALAESLKENSTLTQLNLIENFIGIEGANSLTECLKENTSLTQLDISFNNIGVKGARTLFESLKRNMSLTELSFEGSEN